MKNKNSVKTSSKVAKEASKELKSKDATQITKTLAGSALVNSKRKSAKSKKA